MKDQASKTEYVRLRADGRSYAYIAATIHISKSTCAAWEKELRETIAELKQERLNELYQTYAMTKEARIKQLGSTLEKIGTALDRVDFNAIDPAKLLDYRLKYMEALKGEYIGIRTPLEPEEIDAKGIVVALGDLLNRARSGEATGEQTQRESLVLSQLLKAYENVEIKAKLDALEAILGGRD